MRERVERSSGGAVVENIFMDRGVEASVLRYAFQPYFTGVSCGFLSKIENYKFLLTKSTPLCYEHEL